ncbi:MAG: hypothetical protein JWL83_57 [Actinomycetia bacterium]|nr:hypothetical protein [Actinomycetes bacterium]
MLARKGFLAALGASAIVPALPLSAGAHLIPVPARPRFVYSVTKLRRYSEPGPDHVHILRADEYPGLYYAAMLPLTPGPQHRELVAVDLGFAAVIPDTVRVGLETHAVCWCLLGQNAQQIYIDNFHRGSTIRHSPLCSTGVLCHVSS